jgi:hypothetical protein
MHLPKISLSWFTQTRYSALVKRFSLTLCSPVLALTQLNRARTVCHPHPTSNTVRAPLFLGRLRSRKYPLRQSATLPSRGKKVPEDVLGVIHLRFASCLLIPCPVSAAPAGVADVSQGALFSRSFFASFQEGLMPAAGFPRSGLNPRPAPTTSPPWPPPTASCTPGKPRTKQPVSSC